MGGKRDRKKLHERKKKIINEPPAWLICCEGKTEALYLKGLVQHFAQGRYHRIHFGVKGCPKSGECSRQHVSLINQVEICSSNSAYEKRWVVHDMDAEGEMTKANTKGFNESLKMTLNRDDISVIWSIPSFEYWLAQHGANYIITCDAELLLKNVASLTSAGVKNGVQCTDEYQKSIGEKKCGSLKRCIKVAEKPFCNSFEFLGGEEGLANAIKHSKKRYEELGIAPDKTIFNNKDACTNMHELVENIRAYFDGEYYTHR